MAVNQKLGIRILDKMKPNFFISVLKWMNFFNVERWERYLVARTKWNYSYFKTLTFKIFSTKTVHPLEPINNGES